MQEDCIAVALGLPQVKILWQKELEDHFEVTVIYHRGEAACLRCGRVTTREYLGREVLHQTVRRTAQKEKVGEGLVRRCVAEEIGRRLGAREATEIPEFIAWMSSR